VGDGRPNFTGMPRRRIVGGNWKCNPESIEEIDFLCNAYNDLDDDFELAEVEVIAFPSAPHLAVVRSKLKQRINVGAQSISKSAAGAFTGEWTATMACSVGANWTLIGHSERRHIFNETIEDTVEKTERAVRANLGVVFCIGELLEEREQGQTLVICAAQLDPVLSKVTDWTRFVLAYEPVWAIGTGVVATKDQAQEAHEAIRDHVRATCGDVAAETVRIMYGGSVTKDNCANLLAQPDIDGLLVGGASLKPTFVNIVERAAEGSS